VVRNASRMGARHGKGCVVMSDKTPLQSALFVIDALDRESQGLRRYEYREFLEAIAADVNSKLDCLDDEEAESE
jgi:hypothetical protein